MFSSPGYLFGLIYTPSIFGQWSRSLLAIGVHMVVNTRGANDQIRVDSYSDSLIRFRIQIVLALSDKIQIDINITYICGLKQSDTDTVSDIEYQNLDMDGSKLL